MIQMLTLSGREKIFKGKDVIVNKVHEPDSLDSFDVTIINLQNAKLWRHNGNIQSINSKSDFISLSHMIDDCHKTKIIILLPQNYKFKYTSRNGRETNQRELKNMLNIMKEHIFKEMLWVINDVNLIYEKTITKLGNMEFTADFFIADVEEEKIITKSIASEKVTTAFSGNIVLSTLKIKDYDSLKRFLEQLDIVSGKQTYSRIIDDLKMFNDNELENEIHDKKQVILQQKDEIEIAQNLLKRNRRYESILYTSGGELVKVVFEILEAMLGWDLSGFIDKYKEDFRYEICNTVFIGEIKGVNSNVKNEHITQLKTHVQAYEEEEKKDNNIVSLLIINHQKNKLLKERERVNEDQIKLAKSNGILIVETISLLKLFDLYLSQKVSREDCIKLLNTKGILSL